ncbi:MAG: hypothetical protein FWC61_03690 [Proteobacteria bacterium]|nr:hypothetical protein [Pseudomonadota bacterium]
MALKNKIFQTLAGRDDPDKLNRLYFLGAEYVADHPCLLKMYMRLVKKYGNDGK